MKFHLRDIRLDNSDNPVFHPILTWYLGTSEEAVSSKKAKRMKETSEEEVTTAEGARLHTRTPLLTLAGHNEGVSSLEWMEEKKVASASWDHTIKLWDVETAREEKLIQGVYAWDQWDKSRWTTEWMKSYGRAEQLKAWINVGMRKRWRKWRKT